jgi:hypothetical protein
MASVTIKFSTDNAAFGETCGETSEEIARILEQLAADIRERDYEFVFDEQAIPLHDGNGNKVGKAQHNHKED